MKGVVLGPGRARGLLVLEVTPSADSLGVTFRDITSRCEMHVPLRLATLPPGVDAFCQCAKYQCTALRPQKLWCY